MKKSTTKKTEALQESVSNDPINETETQSNGPMTEKVTTTPQMDPILIKKVVIRDFIQNLPVSLQLHRIVIDDINEETSWLVDALWDLRVQFIVAGEGNAIGMLHTKTINRSGSMGRWRVVNFAQVLLEPCELYINYKELTDAQSSKIVSKQTYRYQDL